MDAMDATMREETSAERAAIERKGALDSTLEGLNRYTERLLWREHRVARFRSEWPRHADAVMDFVGSYVEAGVLTRVADGEGPLACWSDHELEMVDEHGSQRLRVVLSGGRFLLDLHVVAYAEPGADGSRGRHRPTHDPRWSDLFGPSIHLMVRSVPSERWRFLLGTWKMPWTDAVDDELKRFARRSAGLQRLLYDVAPDRGGSQKVAGQRGEPDTGELGGETVADAHPLVRSGLSLKVGLTTLALGIASAVTAVAYLAVHGSL